MDGFKKLLKKLEAGIGVGYSEDDMLECWQASAKQRDAEYEQMSRHERETLIEGAITDERKRIVADLRSWSYEYHPNYNVMRGQHARELADRIRKRLAKHLL